MEYFVYRYPAPLLLCFVHMGSRDASTQRSRVESCSLGVYGFEKSQTHPHALHFQRIGLIPTITTLSSISGMSLQATHLGKIGSPKSSEVPSSNTISPNPIERSQSVAQSFIYIKTSRQVPYIYFG